MDPDVEVMDDQAVRWGQEIWNSWFGSSHAVLLPFTVGEKGFSFKNRTTAATKPYQLRNLDQFGFNLVFYF